MGEAMHLVKADEEERKLMEEEPVSVDPPGKN